MASQATGLKPTTRASANTPSGSKKGMEVGPVKPTARKARVGVPVKAQESTPSAKPNPMYTGKSSRSSRVASQYGTGTVKGDGKGFNDQAALRTKPAKQVLRQG